MFKQRDVLCRSRRHCWTDGVISFSCMICSPTDQENFRGGEEKDREKKRAKPSFYSIWLCDYSLRLVTIVMVQSQWEKESKHCYVQKQRARLKKRRYEIFCSWRHITLVWGTQIHKKNSSEVIYCFHFIEQVLSIWVVTWKEPCDKGTARLSSWLFCSYFMIALKLALFMSFTVVVISWFMRRRKRFNSAWTKSSVLAQLDTLFLL